MSNKRRVIGGGVLLAMSVVVPTSCAEPVAPFDPSSAGGRDAGPAKSIVIDSGSNAHASDAGKKGAGKTDAGTADASTESDSGVEFPPEGSPCTSTAPQEKICGKCGTSMRACLDDGSGALVWGAWGACIGELTDDDACDPTVTYADEDCGNCGKRARVCQTDCHFLAGLSCEEPTVNGAPACFPGSKEFLLGASCTGQNQGRYRTCQSNCAWSGLGNCETFTVNSTTDLVAGGDAHSCTVLPNGTMKCWGANYNGQVGKGSTTTAEVVPAAVSGLSSAVATAAGWAFSCAILSNGTVKCWGHNTSGELGNGSTNNAAAPVQVSNVSGAQAITAGWNHACAIVVGGAVKCWGYDSYGSLGDGPGITLSGLPVAVTGVTGAIAISAGSLHTCAVIAGGTVKCWGYNLSGALGLGTTTEAPTALGVPGLSGVAGIATMDDATCALLSNGTVKCWGDNQYGQLGNGSYVESPTPVQVSSLAGAVALSGGANHACAIVSGGAVKCWGDNADGQLGNGSNADSNVPVAVSALTGASSIALGNRHSCARFANGAVKCWGENNDGQLGIASVSDSNVPVSVSNLP